MHTEHDSHPFTCMSFVQLVMACPAVAVYLGFASLRVSYKAFVWGVGWDAHTSCFHGFQSSLT